MSCEDRPKVDPTDALNLAYCDYIAEDNSPGYLGPLFRAVIGMASSATASAPPAGTEWPVVYYRGSGTDVATDLRAIMPREKLQAMVDALRASGDVDQAGTGPDLAEQLRGARARWLRFQPLLRALHTWESQPGGERQLARAFEGWQREEAAALDEDDRTSLEDEPPRAAVEQGAPIWLTGRDAVAASQGYKVRPFQGYVAQLDESLSNFTGGQAVLLVVLRKHAADAWPILNEGPIAVHTPRGPVRVRLEGQRELEDARLNDQIAALSADLARALDRESEARHQLATVRREHAEARREIAELERVLAVRGRFP